jgi:hypothetical protein
LVCSPAPQRQIKKNVREGERVMKEKIGMKDNMMKSECGVKPIKLTFA